MNLLRFQSVFALCELFLLFGYDQVTSAPPSNVTEDDQNPCASPCYESLKELIEPKAEVHIEKDNEIRQLRKRLDDLSDYRDHIKSLNDHIQELRKTNEILRESIQNKNNCGKPEEDLKVKAKDLNECMADQDKLKKEIEIERKSRIEIEGKLKLEMENLRKENERIINELESKSKKDFANHKVKEESLSNELKNENFKSEVSSYKEQLKESQNQLSANNQLTERNSGTIKELEKDIVGGKGKLPQIGCKGLSSGIHTITIPNLDPVSALCNGDISDGGWIVIEKRFDGSQDFYRKWTEYRNGFGRLDGEFFIGLENLHRITNSQRYELYIEMKYFDGKVKFAGYDNFRIGNENEKYELKSIGDYSGTDGDYLHYYVGVKFSTYDQNNDGRENLNFPKIYYGAGWYKFGTPLVNLNGRYYKSYSDNYDAMRWGLHTVKSFQMLIRPKSK